ncbi:hypothetical protein PspLS_06299 [Pyricularia sp. CBS 133598]|nr:hypothetical protein PspLS_06299 [Pyricularia sp. CBS 133598]
MRHQSVWMAAWALGLGLAMARSLAPKCRCTPDQDCWPTVETWSSFNNSLGGSLIKTTPLPLPCYLGSNQDADACTAVLQNFTNETFQAGHPLGYDFPLNSTCPPPTAFGTASDASCTIGSWPVYAVDVHSVGQIQTALEFAKNHNLRTVIKSTGHDYMQRSSGYGSLSIWLHNLRNGFEFFPTNPDRAACPEMKWNGSTMRVSGSYSWASLYPAARDEGYIVVGGDAVGPSSTGGWTQGGGHSPYTRHAGMGADQVVAAQVVLASGEVVRADACNNPDLLWAISGGGPGTYGIVIEMLLKTYPDDRPVAVVDIGFGSVGNATVDAFLDSVLDVYATLPEMSKRGFGGYGAWAGHLAQGRGPLGFTNLYQHTFTYFGSLDEAKKQFGIFQSILPAGDSNTSQVPAATESWTEFPDFGTWYANKVGNIYPVGAVPALDSRLLSKAGLTNKTALRKALSITAGSPGAPVAHTIVQHGLELADEAVRQTSSAANPGWYNSVILDIFERQMDGFQVSQNLEAFRHVREVLSPAMRELSPGTGTYMNEADWGSPHWKEDFFGANWDRLSAIKNKFDPQGVFYCHNCAGSEEWTEMDGRLCRL